MTSRDWLASVALLVAISVAIAQGKQRLAAPARHVVVMRRRAVLVFAIPALLVSLLGAPATAATRSFDVRTDHVFRILNVIERVGAVGDVNGDGLSDLVASTYLQDSGHAGACVVFGSNSTDDVDCREPGGRGFLVYRSLVVGNEYNYYPSSAGDVNGDGYADVLVIAPRPDRSSGGAPWHWDRLYVILGSSSPASVDLSSFDEGTQGEAGFTVKSPDDNGLHSPGAAGDINRDGLDDIVVEHLGRSVAYVIFGTASESDVDLAAWERGTQGRRGYRITGPKVPDKTTFQVEMVRRAGDINGDGLGDIVIPGWHFSGNPEYSGPAAGTYIALGKKDGSPIRLRKRGTKSFRIFGGSWDVEPAGDMNADGKDDLVTVGGGLATVVFGSKSHTQVDLARLGSRGYHIVKRSVYGALPEGVDVAPDMNRDGIPEVIVVERTRQTSHMWVVYGQKGTRNVDVTKLNHHGFRIDGDVYSGTGDDMYRAYAADDFVGVRDITGDARGEIALRGRNVAYVFAGR
ncbi:MAG: FG-GAP repeat protein [Actinomycetota bacterium]|nr:FG-GAP repeat protein [Actinomycetota bacterium]